MEIFLILISLAVVYVIYRVLTAGQLESHRRLFEEPEKIKAPSMPVAKKEKKRSIIDLNKIVAKFDEREEEVIHEYTKAPDASAKLIDNEFKPIYRESIDDGKKFDEEALPYTIPDLHSILSEDDLKPIDHFDSYETNKDQRKNELLKKLRNPETIRESIIISEIFKRPQF